MLPNITDGDLSFPNLNSGVDPNPNGTSVNPADDFQTNLIMPEPTLFLNAKLGPVSIIRPTSTAQGGAVASVVSFVDDRLFLDPATNKNTGMGARQRNGGRLKGGFFCLFLRHIMP